MTKTRITKRALLMSALSLVLSISMLVGSTFAWFTDSVTSANNVIKSGNLDVELYYQAEGQSEWTKVTETTNVFKENALWEPGYTEVVKLKVVNEGSLALKYTLGVNVAEEVGSVNMNGKDFKLSEFIKFGIVDGEADYTRETAIAAVDANATALNTAYNTNVTALDAKNDTDSDEKIITMVVYMPTTVGNDANHKDDAAIPTIKLGVDLFATQQTSEADSFNNQYDKNAVIVTTAAEAQDALDNAEKGTTIKLAPNVNYGTLYIRPVTGNSNTITDCDYLVYRNEMLRKVEDITIVGAPGAVVDAFEVVSGHIEGSTGYVVDINNLVIDSVEFNDTYTNAPHSYAAPVFFDLSYINVDGLTVKNCKLIGDNDKMNLVYIYSSGKVAFDNIAKNITLTGNTVDGIARLCELRQTENVTITDNVINNTALHGMLLTTNEGTYSGNVTITGNVANGLGDRFVRMANAGDAVVVIKNNTLNAYMGKDADYIKVTNGNNVTIEDNVLASVGVKNAEELAAAMVQGGKIVLTDDVAVVSDEIFVTVPAGKSVTLDMAGHKIDATLGNQVDGVKATTAVIKVENGAELVIDGDGEFYMAPNKTTSYSSTIILNQGVTVINSGKFEVMSGTSYSGGYIVPTIIENNAANTRNCSPTLTINGGTFSFDRNLIRNFPERLGGKTTITINGGTFTATDDEAAIWNQWGTQPPNAIAPEFLDKHQITINGGVFENVVITDDFYGVEGANQVIVADGVDVVVK